MTSVGSGRRIGCAPTCIRSHAAIRKFVEDFGPREDLPKNATRALPKGPRATIRYCYQSLFSRFWPFFAEFYFSSRQLDGRPGESKPKLPLIQQMKIWFLLATRDSFARRMLRSFGQFFLGSLPLSALCEGSAARDFQLYFALKESGWK